MFVRGQDGYWYNSVHGDFDAKRGMLDIEPVDRDMRAFNVSVRRNAEERYTKKPSTWEKYGTIILSGMFILIMILGGWFVLDKIAEVAGQVGGSVNTANQLCSTCNNVLNNIETICALENLPPNSGIQPA